MMIIDKDIEMNVAALIEEDTKSHTLEELEKMRDYASSKGFNGLALELTHMIADKTMEEVNKGNIKTFPFTGSADLLK